MTKTIGFISIEGIEGVGKSTALSCIEAFFDDNNIPLCKTREPGGTVIGEKIRDLCLSPDFKEMCSDTELLLMFASRAQHIVSVIKPALARGEWVVTDRFTDASYAYQGGGRGIDEARIAKLEQWVQADLQPDLTLLLDAPLEMALARANLRSQPDRIELEKQSFFKRVRDTYLARADTHPERFVIIDASVALEDVHTAIQQVLQQRCLS